MSSSFQLSFERWDSITFWLTFFGTVLLAVGVLTGVMARRYARSLSAEKDKEAEEAQLAHDRAIAAANVEIETLRKATAEANSRSATAHEEAAKANQIAEQERLARIRLEASLAPRILNAEQQGALAALVKGLNVTPQNVDIFVFSGDQTDSAFSQQLASALSMAGWTIRIWTAQLPGGSWIFGIVTLIAEGGDESNKRAAQGITAGLVAAHVAASFDQSPFDRTKIPGTMALGPAWDQSHGAAVRVYIGKKL